MASSIITGYMQKRATEKAGNQAAQAQRESTQMGIDEMRRQYDTSRADMAPWQAAGTNALYDLQDLLGMESTLAPWQVKENEEAAAAGQPLPHALPTRTKRTPEEMVMQDPSYLWRRDQGRKVVEGSAAAKGGLFSGNALKALDDYGQNTGLSEYTNIFNRLAGISGTGQTSAATTGAWGNQFGRDAAQGYQNMGNATANAILNKGSAQAGFYGNIQKSIDKTRDAAMKYFMGGGGY
jgi:hypothetical protein